MFDEIKIQHAQQMFKGIHRPFTQNKNVAPLAIFLWLSVSLSFYRPRCSKCFTVCWYRPQLEKSVCSTCQLCWRETPRNHRSKLMNDSWQLMGSWSTFSPFSRNSAWK